MPSRIPAPFLRALLAAETPVPEKLSIISSLRADAPDRAPAIDRLLVQRNGELQKGLEEAQANQDKLRKMLDKLTAPPWHAGTYVGMVATPHGPMLEVTHGGARHVVGVADDLDPETLQCGDEVYLSHERNLVMARSESLPTGESATFERVASDGRVVLRWRDEEVVVLAAHGLDPESLKPGDVVRWDRMSQVAHEKLRGTQGDSYFLEETPSETFERIGGLREQIEGIKRTILLRLRHPDLADLYGLEAARSVMLVGGPGLGKTMIARALANWLASISESGRSRFMHIKPGSLHSMWYAQSEQNYRDVFRVAREAGAREPGVPVVMFFDEVDANTGTRGGAASRVDDRVMNAFAAELDGLVSRGNVLIVAATNRPDTIDPAMLRPGRLGDRIVTVPRPDRAAAIEILSKYLPDSMPVEGRHEDLLEALVSHLYAPNGRGELATITFADSSRRTVTAPDLVSGAVLKNIADQAREKACFRAARHGEGAGQLALHDLLDAADRVFGETARLLTRFNCHNHLTDLPADATVAGVEPHRPKVHRPHRFVKAS
jgi:proteasome-associated ATPase